MSEKFGLQTPLFALYSYANRKGWLATPLAKRLFRESYFLYKKYYEDPFWRLVTSRPSLFRAGHVLDVGANIGYTAYCFANATDPGFFVYAFEPEAVNFEELVKTAAEPSVRGRIEPRKLAVGSESGHVDLWINDDHHADHRIATSAYRASTDLKKIERVELVSLDGFTNEQNIQDRIRFIKIDVQGYELAVCAGMVGVLDANPDVTVAVEYSPDHLRALGYDPETLLSFFRDRQFHPYVLSRHRTGKLMWKWDWHTMEAEGYMDILFSRRELS